jgi:anti-sigma-K factor RskA
METGVHELTAGYALDALDSEERRAYEAHLPGCESCRAELAAFWETTAALAVAASGPAPPAELKERILATVRAEPPVVVPLAPRRRRVVPALAAAAAVAAVVALATGLWATRLSGELDETRAALALLADPGARTVALRSGSGRLVVGPDGRALLLLPGLEPAPAGKTYEVWIVASGSPRPAGLFDGRDAIDVVTLEGRVEPGAVVAVTVEAAGGVPAPTSDPVVASAPV